MELAPNTAFKPTDTTPVGPSSSSAVQGDLGALKDFDGTWSGSGFNLIWRPAFGNSPAHFLALNETADTITFAPIPGQIPNRGLFQGTVFMTGLHYLQQITDRVHDHSIMHIEPGIWARVPSTTNPDVQESYVRMASIPHGTTVLAQGSSSLVAGQPNIPALDIRPFMIGQPTAWQDLDEADFSKPSQARDPATETGRITQRVIGNPNVLLQDQIRGLNITETTEITVTSVDGPPVPGGGTSNTAFLGNKQPSNAQASRVTSTFWIETVTPLDGSPPFKQIQYSQIVLLDFDGRSWPHITVATLFKVPEGSDTPPASNSPTPTPDPVASTPPIVPLVPVPATPVASPAPEPAPTPAPSTPAPSPVLPPMPEPAPIPTQPIPAPVPSPTPQPVPAAPTPLPVPAPSPGVDPVQPTRPTPPSGPVPAPGGWTD